MLNAQYRLHGFLLFVILIISISVAGCSKLKTIEDPKWGFRVDVPLSFDDRGLHSDEWIDTGAGLKLAIGFGALPDLARRSDSPSIERSVSINGYDAVIYSFDKSGSDGSPVSQTMILVFKTWPEAYGEGHPPYFLVEFPKSEEASAARILHSVRFFNP